MKSVVLLSALAASVTAFPFALDALAGDALAAGVVDSSIEKRQVPSTGAAVQASKQRNNCGPNPCPTFTRNTQFVSTSGDHAYRSPLPNQIRGPCPGLNAAANHAYLPRSGVATIAGTITGLDQAFGMGADLAGFLAAYAVLVDGDPVLGTWSIGGPPPTSLATRTLLGKAQGISYSHNNYEGDVSIGRADAYLNGGDAHSLIPQRFAEAYAYTCYTRGGRGVTPGCTANNRYTLDAFAQNYGLKLQQSISQNPYLFIAPFSGLVAPAAYNFVINFMSNHTQQEPNGYLDQSQFKTWFGVTGPNNRGQFTWLRGQEHIPENWYRRPSTSPYTIPGVIQDLLSQFAAYPTQARFGGNTGTTNSFVGVDPANILGSTAFNSANLLKGNNLQCFFLQGAQAAIPDAASRGLQTVAAVTSIVSKYFTPALAGLGCPAVEKYDQSLFNQFPGYSYSPSGRAQNY